MNKWNEESMGAVHSDRIELDVHTLPAHWVYYTRELQRRDMGQCYFQQVCLRLQYSLRIAASKFEEAKEQTERQTFWGLEQTLS